MVRRIVAFVVALLVMVVAGSTSHSLFVQNAWSDSVGMAEGAPGALQTGERISWIAHDFIGLEPLYGALTGVALLIAFLAAGLMARYTGLRPIVFAVAGAVAIFVLFTVMRMQLGTVGVFGARGLHGLGAQMAIGLVAGLLFAFLSRPRTE